MDIIVKFYQHKEASRDQYHTDSIFQVASGFMASKHLYVANEVGLFKHLADGPVTLDELSQRIGVPCHNIRVLADAMVVIGFVERQGDSYQNGPVASTFLSGRTAADLRPLLRFWNKISYPAWVHLEETIRTSRPAVGHLEEELTKIVSEGVEALTSGAAMALRMIHDFRQHRRVLDLGGGTGSFLVALLRQHQGLEATLFDVPDVAAIARQRLASNPLMKHVKIVEGDIFKDPIPPEHDVILVANVVHLLSPAHNRELLRRIREQIANKTRLLLVDLWTDPTHTQPTFGALLAGEFMIASGEGASYGVEEMRVWLQENGWRVLEHKSLAGPASLIVAETA